jgi:hypothetical protein
MLIAKPGGGAVQERRAGLGPFVGVDLGVGDPAVVVDSDMDEVEADAVAVVVEVVERV